MNVIWTNIDKWGKATEPLKLSDFQISPLFVASGLILIYDIALHSPLMEERNMSLCYLCFTEPVNLI